MNNKKAVFSTLFCIFIAALFILGCNNHLLKPQQDEPHLLVRIVNSTGARNATTTGEWQISAWIENQNGTESHHQNVTSASGSKVSITFDDLVIGSQINIHLELTKIDDTQTKFTGESGWTTIKEGVNVVTIVLYDPAVGLSWADSTLTIYNETGLINFRKIVNGDVSTSAPITVGDKTFSGQDRTVNARLAADIELTEDWTPIANNSTYPYAGTFDGAGHTVSGINVTGGGNPKGFFGSIGTNKAIIKNLTVEGTVDVSYYAGGIAGYVDGGTIEYCVNKINVTSTTTTGTGGIAGYIAGSGATITGCVNFGAVQGNNYTGGIAGSSYSNSTTSPQIAHCINFGSVKTTDSSSKASGIYGFSVKTSDNITNCANFGTITSSSSGSGAGITNTDNYLTIQYCLSAGEINATKIYTITSSTSGTQTKNYYDSSKITGATTTGGTGKTTSALKVASASSLDSSWSTNWSFASGRYPLPNIQDNILPEIWTEIENSVK